MTKFGTIGNAGTQATRNRLPEEPLVGKRAHCTLNTPQGVLLSSTYVETLISTRGRGEGTDAQQTSSVIPGDGLWRETTVGDVLDTAGERLCYIYE